MPRRKLSPDLKNAIHNLSDKEKDKLIYRILPSHSNLVDRLEFELLEGGETRQDRRDELADDIINQIELSQQSFYPPAAAMRDLRDWSKQINRHVFATKDKFGEIFLNLLMMNQLLEQANPRLFSGSTHKAEMLRRYIVRRSLKILKLRLKLHEDLQFDLQEDFEALGERLQQHRHFAYTAVHHQFNLEAIAAGELEHFSL